LSAIENLFIQVCVNEDRELFEIHPAQSEWPSLNRNRILIKGSFLKGKRFTFNPRFSAAESKKNGNMELIYSGLNAEIGLEWKVIFSTPANRPFALWMVEITNRSSQTMIIEQIALLETEKPDSYNVFFPEKDGRLAFYSNGWQSWSSSGAYMAGSRMRHSNLGFLQNPMVINPGTPGYRAKGKFSSDFFGVLGDLGKRSGLLLGFLSQKNHFGSLTADLRGEPVLRLWANGDRTQLNPGASMSTDWAVCGMMDIDDPQPLGAYFDAVAEKYDVKALPSAPAGWCSWYYYYEKISAGIIADNLNRINAIKERLPLNLIQIDDGFEAQVGDWLETNPRFPQGMAQLAREIENAGFTPGLWLAPFALHPNSRIAVEHPDWLLRRENGKLARGGFGWNSLMAALDLTVPEALEYACGVVDAAVHQWGFPYLKLDFLFAAALNGKYHDPTRTRAQVMRAGMEALRRSAGEETILLGCGLPLGSALGLVQAMRIGADVSGSWKPFYFGMGLPFNNEPHMPSARNSIQNILARAGMHRRWWVNDPDCLLVRPDSRLNLDEVRTLATAIGMTGGSVLLSDNMTELPEDRLEIAAALLPPIENDVQALDWLDAETPQKLRIDLQGAVGKWHVLAYFNWQDAAREIRLRPEDFRLPADDYWVRSFWDNRVWNTTGKKKLFAAVLQPHATLLLALRAYQPEKAAYLGSSLHISQGMEVGKWINSDRSINLHLSPGRQARACVDVYLPAKIEQALFEGKPIKWEEVGVHCYRFKPEVSQSGELVLKYENIPGF